MALGRQAKNVVYRKMGKPKYASDKHKEEHRMSSGKMMSDREMAGMMKKSHRA